MADTPECATARAHTAVRDIFQRAEQDIQQQVQALLNRYRHEGDWRQVAIKQREELDDLRAANRAYAQTLTAVRDALGAVDDDDLAEAARALVAENEGRRKALEQVSEERRAEWTRAERAEADRDRLLSVLRAYKAAVDGPNGVADAQARCSRG